MAQHLVTQVSREDANSAQKKEKGLLSSIFCCFTNNNGAPAIQQQQQQQQQGGNGTAVAQRPAPTQIIRSVGPMDPGFNLLPEVEPDVKGKKCVVLDLDETLVHSSFKPVPNADYIVPIEIDGQQHHVYVLKRPHVDEFLKALSDKFEVVLFTASLSKYADPVTDLLDPARVCRYRLFREHCVYHEGSYVKDLSRLGRDITQTVIVDNSPASYIFQPDHAVACISWFDNKKDTELLDMIPFFEKLATVDDVTTLRWVRGATY